MYPERAQPVVGQVAHGSGSREDRSWAQWATATRRGAKRNTHNMGTKVWTFQGVQTLAPRDTGPPGRHRLRILRAGPRARAALFDCVCVLKRFLLCVYELGVCAVCDCALMVRVAHHSRDTKLQRRLFHSMPYEVLYTQRGPSRCGRPGASYYYLEWLTLHALIHRGRVFTEEESRSSLEMGTGLLDWAKQSNPSLISMLKEYRTLL